MARTKRTPAEPAPAVEVLPAVVKRIEEAQTQHHIVIKEADARVRAVAQQLGYMLPADATDPDLIQRDIAANMRRSVEACLEVGKGLQVLHAACGAENFVGRIGVLGIERSVAFRFMQAATKFTRVATSRLQSVTSTQSKLFELLVLDDEQIAELELTGQTGELSLDDVATMSVKELRAALRQAKQDNEFTGEQLAKERARADKAEKKLRGKVPEVPPLDERITPFQVEITERQSLLEKGVAAHLEAVAALDTWWTEEVTARPDYDPESPVDMPKPVGLVLMHLVGSANRLAAMVGQLQHALEERFGGDIAAATQYLMQEPVAAGQVDA